MMLRCAMIILYIVSASERHDAVVRVHSVMSVGVAEQQEGALSGCTQGRESAQQADAGIHAVHASADVQRVYGRETGNGAAEARGYVPCGCIEARESAQQVDARSPAVPNGCLEGRELTQQGEACGHALYAPADAVRGKGRNSGSGATAHTAGVPTR